MKLYLNIGNAEGTDDPAEIEDAKRQAQRIANQLGVTVQLDNGNYGSYIIDPKKVKEVVDGGLPSR